MFLNNAFKRFFIGFLGCTNAGKSSLVNALTNQEVSLVSEVKGTTTDFVKKSMELPSVGACVFIDTAGINDKSELGSLRKKKSYEVLNKIDIAILVVDSIIGISKNDKELIDIITSKNIPLIVVYNKSDLIANRKSLKKNEIYVSSKTRENIDLLIEKIGEVTKECREEKNIIIDKLKPNDLVILVIPIDTSAPKDRLILPQQKVLRELLDYHSKVLCCQHTELKDMLSSLNVKPKLIITDSQVFKKVKKIVPNNILITSFSILFARYKGDLGELIKGVKTLSKLKDNDKILISEACTHKRQCNDIGSIKLPNWIENFSKKDLKFEFTSGTTFAKDLSKYRLIIHCGGCMLNAKEMQYRINLAKEFNIPITNYGLSIAYMNGIVKRSLEIFPEYLEFLG